MDINVTAEELATALSKYATRLRDQKRDMPRINRVLRSAIGCLGCGCGGESPMCSGCSAVWDEIVDTLELLGSDVSDLRPAK